MWKAPYRPRQSEVSQSYNDGVVTIYELTDEARPGYQPRPGLREKGTLHFAELRMGLQRYYSARQNQIDVDKVIRVPRGFAVNSQDVAKILGDDRQYRIDLVQLAEDVYPASLDLTLSRIEQIPGTGEEGDDGSMA